MGEHAYKPRLPEVTDEAKDSSWWLPVIGVVLVLAFAIAAIATRADDVSATDQAPDAVVVLEANTAN